MAKITVIIPVFNREDIIDESLQSVLFQTFEDWECLIIDDFSTDGTRQKVEAYCLQDKRFKYLLNDRSKGAQGARNTGISNASGDYNIFLDSDDLLATNCLQHRFQFKDENPGFDFYCFHTAIFVKKPGDTNLLWNYLYSNNDDLLRFLNIDTPWHTSGVMWKKETLRKLGGWDEVLMCYQDWDIHLRAILDNNLKYMKATDQPADTYYRIDESSPTISKLDKTVKNLDSKIYLVEKFLPLLPLTNHLGDINTAFGRFAFSVAKQIYKLKGNEEGRSFLLLILRKLKFPSNHAVAWNLYAAHRRNMKFPKIFRKGLDIIPFIFNRHSLQQKQTTLKIADASALLNDKNSL